MRTPLFALALVLISCGRSDRASAPAVSHASSAATMRGPDQIVLRFPLGGGQARAFAYPQLDSVLWRSDERVPPLGRVLAFDDEAGSVAALDDKGAPVRIDLRLGRVSRDTKVKLTHVVSSDGSAIFGIAGDGSVVRLTPTGSWTFKPPSRAREVIPEPHGSLLVLADRGDRTVVWQLYPPDRAITDSALVPRAHLVARTEVGDRVYFTAGDALVGLRARGLEPAPEIRLDRPVRALTITPSGDRLYLVTEPGNRITVVGRYSNKVETRIALPGTATELRMDPTGRYVLARPAAGDSAWVIATGTDRRLGTVATAWRTDLPTMTASGSIALARGGDVVFVDGEALRSERVVKDGAKDRWLFVAWNGFRPRSAGLDEPVTFDSDAEVPIAESISEHGVANEPAAPRAQAPPTRAPAEPRVPPRPRDTTAAHGWGFTVQFAALRSLTAAESAAHGIMVEGKPPRVIATERAAVMIYRVVAGPFASREDAERAARSSGKPYWIYEGAP